MQLTATMRAAAHATARTLAQNLARARAHTHTNTHTHNQQGGAKIWGAVLSRELGQGRAAWQRHPCPAHTLKACKLHVQPQDLRTPTQGKRNGKGIDDLHRIYACPLPALPVPIPLIFGHCQRRLCGRVVVRGGVAVLVARLHHCRQHVAYQHLRACRPQSSLTLSLCHARVHCYHCCPSIHIVTLSRCGARACPSSEGAIAWHAGAHSLITRCARLAAANAPEAARGRYRVEELARRGKARRAQLQQHPADSSHASQPLLKTQHTPLPAIAMAILARHVRRRSPCRGARRCTCRRRVA